LRHFLQYGGFEERDPSGEFSSSWYPTTYSDVQSQRTNPLVHYIKFGKEEGQLPKNPSSELITNLIV
jgi:hypothetical protein